MFVRPLLAATMLVLALPIAAGGEIKQGPKAVLELFTSQGCSSCPPADALLTELAARPDVVALAYHVDYWDYMGWPDSFGSKANSDRQRDYAAAKGAARIFTPQLMVNGAEGVVASRKGDVGAALAKAALPLAVTLKYANDMLMIDVPSNANHTDEAVISLISFIDKADVTIPRGENEGKTIAYTQIVVDRQVLGMWEPRTGARFKLPLSEVVAAPANGAVILVQSEHERLPGRILGAASFVH